MKSILFFLIFACAVPPKSAGFFEDDETTGDSMYHLAAETCHADVEGWSSISHLMEMEVIDFVNDMRSQQQDCRSEGQFPPVHPLKYEPHLQCSSRYHSHWMAENGSLNHDSPGGDLGNDLYQRVENANYNGYAVGENIAAGYDSARSVVRGWMESDGHCSIIMSPDAEDIGVGYFMDESTVYLHWWTLNVGSVF